MSNFPPAGCTPCHSNGPNRHMPGESFEREKNNGFVQIAPEFRTYLCTCDAHNDGKTTTIGIHLGANLFQVT